MHSNPTPPHPVSEAAIAQLVGQVYEIAPPPNGGACWSI
jgi:hypothetical protein